MNRTHALVAALALALALPAAAQTTTPEPKLQTLPPPALNDPGVKAGEPDRSGQKPIEKPVPYLSLIHISEPTRPSHISRMPSSA